MLTDDELRAENAALRQRVHDLKFALGDGAGWFDRAMAAERERDAARAEVERVTHCFICVECGILGVKTDEDGCCASCGRDCLIVDGNKVHASATRAGIEFDAQERMRPVVEAAVAWRDSRHVPGIETIHDVNEDGLADAVDAYRKETP